MDVISALPGAALILSAIAFAYLFFNFLDALTIHPEVVARLDQEFEIADAKIEELRQDGENNDGSIRVKINK